MSPEEAIKVFEAEESRWKEREQARLAAIIALKKQIPVSPIVLRTDKTGSREQKQYGCPRCQKWLPYITMPHHCTCGQAITWREIVP